MSKQLIVLGSGKDILALDLSLSDLENLVKMVDISRIGKTSMGIISLELLDNSDIINNKNRNNDLVIVSDSSTPSSSSNSKTIKKLERAARKAQRRK